MTKDEILIVLGEIFREVKESERNISPQDDTRNLGMDSLDMINFFFSVEEKLGVSISMEELEDQDLFSFGALADFIKERLSS